VQLFSIELNQSHRLRWEGPEVAVKLISKLVMVSIERILLETDTERVKNSGVGSEIDFCVVHPVCKNLVEIENWGLLRYHSFNQT